MIVTYIIQLISLIASFGVIGMTYHIYRLNNRNNQIDSYLKQIISLYFRIEDDYKIVIALRKEKSEMNALSQVYRRLEINATLMNYYLRNYPEHNKNNVGHLEKILDSISHSPEILDDYNLLTDEFKKFCKCV